MIDLLGGLLGALLSALLGALILQFACNIALKFKPPYGTAFAAVVVSSIVGFLVGLVATVALVQLTVDSWITPLTYVLTGYISQVFVYSRILERPTGDAISIREALTVVVTQILIALLVVAGLAAVVMLVIALAG